jgi:hypothetical protein
MKSNLKSFTNHNTGSPGQEIEEEKGRLSIAKCRELLTAESRNLTDDQIIKIRDFMYRLAAIGYEEYRYQQQQAKVIHLEKHTIVNYENSHYLRTG